MTTSEPPEGPIGAPELLLVRYGELALKGSNRSYFEDALVRNIRHAMRNTARVKIVRTRGRISVACDERPREVAQRLRDVFGISSFSPAWGTEPEPEAIATLAHRVMAQALAAVPGSGPLSFRVSTRRGDKRFPLNSQQLNIFVAERILPDLGERLQVKLSGAELELGIDVRDKRAFVFAERIPGLGGLPVGTLGRVTCLLSGGIDSPVAAWMAMKRGCLVSFVSFHSYPYIGESSKRKIARLVRELARFQHRNRLFVVPFTETQEAIRDHCPPNYRTVLYRRMMQRIASRIASRDKSQALITGDSIGQVASQTLENLTTIQEASRMPVLRPLLAFDKHETIEIAKRIGTYPISIEPEPDCCTVFQPPRPVIRGTVEECHAAEEKIDVEGLIERALAGVEASRLEE